jgi:hypothetical protein
MSTTDLTLVVFVALVVVAVVVALVALLRRRKTQARRRSEELRGAFGAEYERTVQSAGTRRDAEEELTARQQRHDSLDIRPLPAASRQRYLAAWDSVQTRFVDRPVLALTQADQLVTQLMTERGYPTDGANVQEEMLSVEHAAVLDNFRAGHAIEAANREDHADTEQVRQGMLHFHSVFEELVEDGDAGGQPYPGDGSGRHRKDADQSH